MHGPPTKRSKPPADYLRRGLTHPTMCMWFEKPVLVGIHLYRERRARPLRFSTFRSTIRPEGNTWSSRSGRFLFLLHIGFHCKRFLLAIVGTHPVRILPTYTVSLPFHLSFDLHMLFRVFHCLLSLGSSLLLLAPPASFVRSLIILYLIT